MVTAFSQAKNLSVALLSSAQNQNNSYQTNYGV